MLTAAFAAAILLVAALAGLFGYTRLVHQPPAGEDAVLVASGRNYFDNQGKPRAFRIIRSKRYVRYPVIESVQPFSLEPLEFDWETTAAPAELDQNFQIRGHAVVRPASEDSGLRQAIQNFIGLDRSEIARAAALSVETTVQHDLQDVPAARARDTEADWVAETAHRAADELDEFGLLLDEFEVTRVTADEKT